MNMLPRVGDQFGRYRIETQIGRGGMGVVLGATDTTFDRRVALKVISTDLGDPATSATAGDFQRRFEREAALLARLNSPHVIAIYDYGTHDGCPYIATQYVAGGDLGGLIATRGPMPPNLATLVCAQVADALHDAHRAGVVHRDVKPTNVLLRDADTTDIHAYLCDFGIARTETGEHGLTAPGSVSGTWSYLAPECATGGPGTPASDIYALGCLLWTALTGHPPFGGTDVEIAVAHQQSPVPQLSGEDPLVTELITQLITELNTVLERSLAKDPAARYPDADQMRLDLLGVAGMPDARTPLHPAAIRQPPSPPAVPAPPTAHPTARPTTPPTAAPRPRRRRTGLVAAAVGLAVLAIGGGVLAATQIGDAEPTGQETTSPDPEPKGTDSPGPKAEGAVQGDIDGDGLGDLALFARNDTDGVRVDWTSDGSGLGSPEEVPNPPGADVQRRIAQGDFDGDGRTDLVTVDNPRNKGLGPLAVTADIGDGETLEAELAYPDGGNYGSAHAGDVDGDGLDDLIYVTFSRGAPVRTLVAHSTGDGFGELEEWLDTGQRVQEKIVDEYDQVVTAYGDVDGDGRTDAAVIRSFDNGSALFVEATVEIFLSSGDAFVSDGSPLTFKSDVLESIQSGDIEGDGDDELFLTYFESQEPFKKSWMLDYDEGLQPPKIKGLVPSPEGSYLSGASTTLSDVDGDGRVDLVGVRQSGPTEVTVSVAISRGIRFASSRDVSTTPFDGTPYDAFLLLGETYT
ncbi:MAG: protein kinase [Nocardioides sp.]